MAKEQTARHMTRTKDGLYRYNRRVPDDCQKALRKRLWNLSLGRDNDAAARRAAELRQEHDALIARLRNPETVEKETVRQATVRASARVAELEKRDAPEAVEGESGTVEGTLGALWERIPDILRSARDDQKEYAQLSVMQTLAFGDDSRTDGGDVMQLPPPTDPTDRRLYDAYRDMLAQRLEQLAPLPDQGPPEMRVSALMDRYIKVQALRPNTARSYRQMVKKQIANCGGDHTLP